ncbi:hypothetical protein CEB3_c12220 [Peptococcaceae bacterium CEB3]|nr:hypothetical protein CEB3_c12220 [Peptococcaceae bacterium CEB3]
MKKYLIPLAKSCMVTVLVLTALIGCGASRMSQQAGTHPAGSSIPDKETESKKAILSTVTSDSVTPDTIEFRLTGNLPEGWNISFPQKSLGEIFKKGKQIGWIDVLGYDGVSARSGLPNHSVVIKSEGIKSGLGNGELFTLERAMPAASQDPRTWIEYWAIIPIKGGNVAYSVSIKPDDRNKDLRSLKSILKVLVSDSHHLNSK